MRRQLFFEQDKPYQKQVENIMKATQFLSVICVVFGATSVVSGSIVLFTEGEIRNSVGYTVDFVVWFNMLSGIVYVITGYGLWKMRKWAAITSVAITVSILVVFIPFSYHVIQGGQY